MDVEQFIKDSLTQITNGVKNAKSGDYELQLNSNNGIDFDLAVTTVSDETSSKDLKGGLRIKVVGAEAGKAMTSTHSREVTSRIKFNVDVS
jgi:hypothetical protein